MLLSMPPPLILIVPFRVKFVVFAAALMVKLPLSKPLSCDTVSQAGAELLTLQRSAVEVTVIALVADDDVGRVQFVDGLMVNVGAR